MKKLDVEFHSGLPAVNVKVWGNLWNVKLPLELGRVKGPEGKDFRTVYTAPGFTHEWIEENVTEDGLQAVWEWATGVGWESLQDRATELWGQGVKVYAEGRSGGWAVVHGLDDFESWDAVALARWGSFTKYAEAIVKDIPRSMAELIYFNFWPEDEGDRSADRAVAEFLLWSAGFDETLAKVPGVTELVAEILAEFRDSPPTTTEGEEGDRR